MNGHEGKRRCAADPHDMEQLQAHWACNTPCEERLLEARVGQCTKIRGQTTALPEEVDLERSTCVLQRLEDRCTRRDAHAEPDE